ncbi:MAG: hypothetical protein M1157_01970, partial [Deinococcus sp.]|nr:hypothetical protein [Deinococcus sp.]
MFTWGMLTHPTNLSPVLLHSARKALQDEKVRSYFGWSYTSREALFRARSAFAKPLLDITFYQLHKLLGNFL